MSETCSPMKCEACGKEMNEAFYIKDGLKVCGECCSPPRPALTPRSELCIQCHKIIPFPHAEMNPYVCITCVNENLRKALNELHIENNKLKCKLIAVAKILLLKEEPNTKEDILTPGERHFIEESIENLGKPSHE